MRGTTIISIAVSVVLAALAVFGARTYLDEQRLAMQMNLARPEPDVSRIVVATDLLRFGARIEQSSLKLIPWPENALPPGAFTSFEELLGDGKEPRYAKSAIAVGEPIQEAKITGFGERATLSTALSVGMKAVSIRVNDVLGVAGFVLPGDRVDIMLTRNARDQGDATTDVLLQGVKVLAIDQTADDRTDKPSVVKTVTLEVATPEAQKLTLAQNVGVLSLALRRIASSEVEYIQPIRISDLSGGDRAEGLAAEAPIVTQGQLQPADDDDFIVIGVSRGVNRQEYKLGGNQAAEPEVIDGNDTAVPAVN
jgi:pilus assembly protein CpaB